MNYLLAQTGYTLIKLGNALLILKLLNRLIELRVKGVLDFIVLKGMNMCLLKIQGYEKF